MKKSMKNHEGYADYTAYKAIRRINRRLNVYKKQKPKQYFKGLTFRLGEVPGFNEVQKLLG